MSQAEQSLAVADLVRAGDRDRYLATLFAPEETRGALMALYAFNIELSRIGEVVSEPMLGDIRLQWWRDALEALARGEKTGNPTADALGVAIEAHDLPTPSLAGMIDARAFDLAADVMPDWFALKAYLLKTAGALFALSAQMVNGAPLGSDNAPQEAGLAYGLTGLLRLLPMHRARGRLYLPAAWLADRNTTPEAVFGGQGGEALKDALADLRTEAGAALQRARAAIITIPRPARVAFLPLALVEPYLEALGRSGRDPLRDVADIGQLQRLRRLTWAALSGRL